MTCQDARQWLSDLLDDALEGERRVDVDAHLASCAECRVELDRLRATVSALRELDRPRAPAGFVDRVVQRAHPVPWYRRLYAWLFLPLSVKLPAEAAAVVVIAGLAVLVWQRTPELRDAVHVEPPAPSAPSTAAVDPVAQAPLQSSPERMSDAMSRRTQSLRELLKERPRSSVRPAAPEPPAAHPEQVASVPPAPETKAERETREATTPRPLVLPGSPAGRADRGETRARSAAPAVRRTLGAVPSSDLAGRLVVRDRDAAAVAVVELLARLGGRETGRRQDDSDTVMDVQIPAARYDEFLRGLDGLGAWTASGRPNVLPLDPPQIRLTIRLGG